MKYYRLFGNSENLERTGNNTTCTYYRLTLFIKINGEWHPITAEKGFNGCTKKEIYSRLKSAIIEKLMDQYHIKAL